MLVSTRGDFASVGSLDGNAGPHGGVVAISADRCLDALHIPLRPHLRVERSTIVHLVLKEQPIMAVSIDNNVAGRLALVTGASGG